MRRCMVVFVIFLMIICCNVLECSAYKVLEDTTIAGSIKEGIRVARSCTLRFENANDIDIGSCDNACAGIEIYPGVTLTIDVTSWGNVNVYGGYYFKEGNEYDCAGIYVPTTSTLVVDSSGRGKLVVYPFDRGAGIGGNGVLMERILNNTNCQDAGKVVVKNGKVEIQQPVEYSGFAKGAGIGGGGICNICEDVKFIYGGSLKMFHIVDGEIIVKTNKEENSFGEGAGIGGGGIANLNKIVDNIRGGDAQNITIDGGKIDLHSGVNENHKGKGVGIGGGGIYNVAEAGCVSKGQLLLLSDSKKAKVNCYGYSGVYGDGSIYSNDSIIETSIQKQYIKAYTKGVKEWITNRILDLGVALSAVFMVFELVT